MGVECSRKKTFFVYIYKGRVTTKAVSITHFRIALSLFIKAGTNLSHENEFNLWVNENFFPYETITTRTRFENEAKGNTEMPVTFDTHFPGKLSPPFHAVGLAVSLECCQ